MTNNTGPELDSPNYRILVPSLSDDEKRSKKDLVNRLGGYATWLDENRRTCMEPALDEYKDYLLEERGLAPATVNAHLATIRSRFRSLLKSGAIQEAVQASQGKHCDRATRAEEVEKVVKRIRHAIAADSNRVEAPPSDIEYLQLTKEHVLGLLGNFDKLLKEAGGFPESIDPYELVWIRDRAILALMYTTGLRENEICALEVDDLNQKLGDEPALHVPEGRGCVERLIPFGNLIWGLEYVNKWLKAADITEGPVFRGFFKGGSLRPSGLSVRALEYILANYPIVIDGEDVKIRPMDLRRAYARLLYESGMSLGAIRENLGVQDINTVLDYIGPVPPGTRIPAPPDNSELSF
jgi:integrase